MERFGLGACDHTWPEFMEAMSSVSNMADFLKVISYITASYHATVNGVPLPEWLISKIFSLLLRDEVSIRRLPSVIKTGDKNFGGGNFETV